MGTLCVLCSGRQWAWDVMSFMEIFRQPTKRGMSAFDRPKRFRFGELNAQGLRVNRLLRVIEAVFRWRRRLIHL